MKKKIYKQFETKKFFSRENLTPKKKPPPLLVKFVGFFGVIFANDTTIDS